MRVPILRPEEMILLPVAQSKCLINQAQAVVSTHKQPEQHFQIEYGTVYQVQSQAHVQLLQKRLTRQFGNLVVALLNEIEVSIVAEWAIDATELREFVSMIPCGWSLGR